MTRADIYNRTRNTQLHSGPRFATTLWQQARGFLMQIPGDRALIFLFLPARAVTIHMWFVFGPLDCIALDGTGRVIALREQLRPWQLWRAPLCSAILELPAGTIAKTKTAVGDVIALPRP